MLFSVSCMHPFSFFSGRPWQFPLAAEVSEGDVTTRYNYQPKSDFSFSLYDIPTMILEVFSDKQADEQSEFDRPRLLIQAACLTRLWNHLLGGREMVIMAVYVEKDLIVSRYLFFQGNGPNPPPVRCLCIKSAFCSHPTHRLSTSFESSILEYPNRPLNFYFNSTILSLPSKQLPVNSARLRMARSWRQKSAEASNPLLVKSLKAPNVRAIKGAMRIVPGIVPNANAKEIRLWIAQISLTPSLRKVTTSDERKKK